MTTNTCTDCDGYLVPKKEADINEEQQHYLTMYRHDVTDPRKTCDLADPLQSRDVTELESRDVSDPQSRGVPDPPPSRAVLDPQTNDTSPPFYLLRRDSGEYEDIPMALRLDQAETVTPENCPPTEKSDGVTDQDPKRRCAVSRSAVIAVVMAVAAFVVIQITAVVLANYFAKKAFDDVLAQYDAELSDLELRNQQLKEELNILTEQLEANVTELKYENRDQNYFMNELKTTQRTIKTNVDDISSLMIGPNIQREAVFVWKIVDYRHRRQSSDSQDIVSSPFYTSRYGYKMRAVVDLNGVDDGKDTHIGVFIGLLKGDYDDLLPWPFTANLAFSLINVNTGREHTEYRTPNFQRPGEIGNIAWGDGSFIEHSLLESEYLYNDTLYFKFKVDITHTYIPYAISPVKTEEFTFIWKITDYARKKNDEISDRVHLQKSDPFYVSPYGYRMKVGVFLNGADEGEGTYVSLYVILVAGDYDDVLPWPFSQSMTITLVNTDGNGKKWDVPLVPRCSQGLTKPTESENIPCGDPRFFEQSIVERDYVRQDTLYIKVAVDIIDI